MKVRAPYYYKNFRCKGTECEDNCCCINWEVDIDKDTVDYYRSLNNEFGEKLCSKIKTNKDGDFFLDKQGRCPFLNSDNLCDVFIKISEEHTGYICREHPRFYEWFDGLKEAGVGLCCEETGRLIFENDTPFSLDTIETDDKDDEEYNNEFTMPLFAARDKAFLIIQDRNYEFAVRMGLLLSFADEVQSCLEDMDTDGIYGVIDSYDDERLKEIAEDLGKYKNYSNNMLCELLKVYDKLEYMDESFHDNIKKIAENLEFIEENRQDFEVYFQEFMYQYEQILLYFTYRYFMKASFDGDLLSRVHFSLISVITINLLDIQKWIASDYKFTLNERIFVAKEYSKEVEYSDDNVAVIYDESCSGKVFEFENLIKIIMR